MGKQSNSTTRRFILTHSVISAAIQPGDSHEIDSTEADILHQLNNVFRIEEGDKVILMNRNDTSQSNTEYLFTVTSHYKRAVSLRLDSQKSICNELSIELNLALAVPNKPAKLEFILEKAVELGVRNIYLIKTEFSQFAHQLRLDRLEKIILEAAEQSERAILPSLQEFHSLKQFTSKHLGNLYVALERSEQSIDLLTIDLPSQITLLIGPEGGFSASERELIASNQIPNYQLGGSILRMETATLLSLGMIRLRAS